MGAQIRVYRQKIASTSSMQKIFKAMEMIATSRINKARRSAQTTGPYANALTRVVTALATQQSVQHPLIHRPDTFGKHEHKRSAVLVMTSDRGLAGSYSSSVLKKTEELIERLRGEGREIQLYLVGRKAKSYFEFRERPYERAWEGHTDNPHIDTAVEIRDVFLEEYEKGHENGGVDDLHIVYTEFKSMVTQETKILRLLPIHVAEATKLGEEIVPDEELSSADYQQPASLNLSLLLRKCWMRCYRVISLLVSSHACSKPLQVNLRRVSVR